ncbi:hypothetical protein [Comamonas sp. lk]|uniref:hypothetical protein n=1 Tax=Comamonas sp. lk TaxID=2201272 RepID=UPI000EB02ACA|nr:hypothetical protein [Comamonas sp. lk]
MTYRIAHSLRQLLPRLSTAGKPHRRDEASRCATSAAAPDLCIDSLCSTQVLDAQTSWPTHRIRSFLSAKHR